MVGRDVRPGVALVIGYDLTLLDREAGACTADYTITMGLVSAITFDSNLERFRIQVVVAIRSPL